MPWWRAEGGMPYHQKILLAGEHLGAGGAGRVLGLFTLGNCYAVEQLTDGFVPRSVMTDRRFDRSPDQVLKVMVEVGLLRNADGGYQIHDFDHYNPSGAELKAKRARDAERKRKERAVREISARTEDGHGAESRALARADGRARSESESDPEERAGEVPRAARCAVTLRDVVRHIRAAVHRQLDHEPDTPDGELAAVAKDAAAACRVTYDGREVTKVVDAVRAIRARRVG